MSKNTEQIQIRIDSKTKNEAKKILKGLGMDMSSAARIFFHQVVNTKGFPCELRDEDGFTPEGARAFEKSLRDGKNSKKSYTNVKDLMKDLNS